MKKLVMVLGLALILALFVLPVHADGIAQTISEKLSIDLVNAQSLTGQGNTTCFAAGWNVVKVKGINAQLDVLILPNYMETMKFGLGASVMIPGKVVNLKLGIGCVDALDKPIVYLGLPLVGGGSNNLAQDKPKVDLQISGGIRLVGQMRF